MNQEEIVEKKEKEEAEEKKGGGVPDIGVYQVCKEDKNIAQSLQDSVKRLIDVRAELNNQSSDLFPFKTKKARDCAQKLCLANIYSEIAALNLYIAVFRSNTILLEQPFDEETFQDFHALGPWLAHVQQLHDQHMQGVHSHLQGLVGNHPDREVEIKRVFESHLQCSVHKKPALGRSIDGKRIICEDCKKEK